MDNKKSSNKDNVVVKELRKENRIEYNSKLECIKYLYKGQEFELNESIQIKLINVSIHGLGIVSNKKFEIDTILVLNIRLEDTLYERISAKVMWNSKNGDMYRHGLEINIMSGRMYSHLSKLDNSIITHI